MSENARKRLAAVLLWIGYALLHPAVSTWANMAVLFVLGIVYRAHRDN